MATVNDEDYRRVLRNSERKITELINPRYLLPVLRAHGLLTESEHQQLEEMPMQQSEVNRKARLFKIMLGKREENTLNSFIKALQEEGEHVGHKRLSIELLAQLSNLKPTPPVPLRKMRAYRAHTLPQSIVRSQAEHIPLTTTRSLNVSGVTSTAYKDHTQTSYSVSDLETEHTDSQESLLDGVHQLKQMGKKLETNLSSQKDIMQRVNYLAKVIVDMQEKMSDMCQLLSELLDNNQENSSFYTYVGQRSGKMEHLCLHCCKDNVYVDDPSSTQADMDSFTSATNKINQPRSSSEYDYATTGHGIFRYMPLSNTNRDSSDGPYHYTRTTKQQMCQQTEVSSPLASSPLQDTDEKHIYNEYTEEQIYETVTESPVIMELEEKTKIADGKSGNFWLAVNKKQGAKMVVKKLFCKEIFMQEKNALAQVRHSNIIRLIDYSETESSVLILEYAENGNLLKCLKSSASNFSTSKLLVISADVACGMLELEKRGIIHCDVLAKSILIDSHFVCKVASFNKAQCLKPGESSYTPPSNVSVMVPTKWAAPEILSKRNFSIKSDVWSFAVLLSEVFSQGNTPYPNMSNTEVKSAVQKGVKMAQPSRCPNEVYEVMKCCFEFDTKNRLSFAVIHEQLKTLLYKDPTNEASSGSDCEDL